MKKEIAEIIERNLPAQTAGVLKDYISQQGDLELKLADAKQVIAAQEKELKGYRKRADDFEKLSTWQDALDMREKEVEDRERNFKLELAELRLELMEKNMNNMSTLVNKIFGHPSVQISTSRDAPYNDQYGNRVTASEFENEMRKETKE